MVLHKGLSGHFHPVRSLLYNSNAFRNSWSLLLRIILFVSGSKSITFFPFCPTSSAAASPPGGWSSLYKLAVCCPGLHQAGVLFENSDFALERELGPDENYQNRVFPESETIHSQPVPCGDVADCGWSLFDDLLFDTIYDASESALNQPEVVEEEPQNLVVTPIRGKEFTDRLVHIWLLGYGI
ncbi:hypothetical protein P3L10_010608 [Capsicum annuum]